MAKKERKIPEVLVWTDINKCAADLGFMVVLAYLADRKLINIRGIVTGRGIYDVRRRRAMYAKGVMANLGYPFLRAVPGGDYDVQNEQEENRYIENEITPVFESAGMTIQRSGTIFLQEYMKSVKEKNVMILFAAPFADFGKYLKATHDTVLKKVKKIVFQGNVLKEKAENGFYLPDLETVHFKLCPDAAKDVFDYVQTKNIRTTIVPSSVAEDFVLNGAYTDAIKKSKNPVVKALLLSRDESDLKKTIYDMISAMCLVDGVFKAGGGVIEKEDESNISFAHIADSQMMNDKLCEIFKEKLEPKTISLSHLSRVKPAEGQDA